MSEECDYMPEENGCMWSAFICGDFRGHYVLPTKPKDSALTFLEPPIINEAGHEYKSLNLSEL